MPSPKTNQFPRFSKDAVVRALCDVIPCLEEQPEYCMIEPGAGGERGVAHISGKALQGVRAAIGYRWFNRIEQPLFYLNEVDPKHLNLIDPISSKPRFFPTLDSHDMPALEVSYERATPTLYAFLQGMLTNVSNDERYKLNKAAGGFFQGGANAPTGGWFLIEFWRNEGVPAWFEYLNKNYDPQDQTLIELARWHAKQHD